MDGERVWQLLESMIGSWQGAGSGMYPTIEDFSYEERLHVEGGFTMPRLRFGQSSVRSSPSGMVESHAESGFIGVANDGTVEMTVAEALDRVEILSGEVVDTDDGWRLDLSSSSVAGDPRVASSWRTYEMSGDLIRYTMGMATGSVPAGGLHLEGALRRI